MHCLDDAVIRSKHKEIHLIVCHNWYLYHQINLNIRYKKWYLFCYIIDSFFKYNYLISIKQRLHLQKLNFLLITYHGMDLDPVVFLIYKTKALVPVNNIVFLLQQISINNNISQISVKWTGPSSSGSHAIGGHVGLWRHLALPCDSCHSAGGVRI
jgi:hypothetical protein